jgi:hypothetical protein
MKPQELGLSWLFKDFLALFNNETVPVRIFVAENDS